MKCIPKRVCNKMKVQLFSALPKKSPMMEGNIL